MSAPVNALKRRTACPSEKVRELHFVGELETGPHVAHMRTCAHCLREVDAWTAARARYVHDHPPAGLRAHRTPNGELRSVARRSPVRWRLGAGGAVALLAAGLGVWLAPGVREASVRLKGDAFHAFHKPASGGATQRLVAGAPLRAGDHLQFEYRSVRAGYLTVLDWDAKRRLSALFPLAGAAPTLRLPADGAALAQSFTLDDALGPETFIAVFSPEPISLEVLQAQAVQTPVGGAPVLHCAGCRVETLSVVKVP